MQKPQAGIILRNRQRDRERGGSQTIWLQLGEASEEIVAFTLSAKFKGGGDTKKHPIIKINNILE